MTNEFGNEIEQLLTDEKPEQTPGNSGFTLDLGSIVLLIGVVSMLAVIGWGFIQQQRSSQPTGGPAPDFTISTFDGEMFTLSEQRGNIVVLNFWGSWCGPCRTEAPHLQAIHERYQDEGVVVVGVTYVDPIEDSLAFIEEFGLTYTNGPDNGVSISEDKYHIQGAPENFVIDRDGNIHYFHLGPITEETLAPILDELLAEGEESAA